MSGPNRQTGYQPGSRPWRPALIFQLGLVAVLLAFAWVVRRRDGIDMGTTLLLWGTTSLLGCWAGQALAWLRLRTWLVMAALVGWWWLLASGLQSLLASRPDLVGLWPHQAYESGLFLELCRLFQSNFVLCAAAGFFSILPRRGLLAAFVPLAFATHLFTYPLTPWQVQSLWNSGEKWRIWLDPFSCLALAFSVLFLVVYLSSLETYRRSLLGLIRWSSPPEPTEGGGVARSSGSQAGLSSGWGSRLASLGASVRVPVLLALFLLPPTAYYSAYLFQTFPVELVPAAAGEGGGEAFQAARGSQTPGSAPSGQRNQAPSTAPSSRQAGGSSSPGVGPPPAGDSAGGGEEGSSGGGAWFLKYLLLILLLILLIEGLGRLRQENPLVRWRLNPQAERSPTQRLEGAWKTIQLVLAEAGFRPAPHEAAGDFLRRAVAGDTAWDGAALTRCVEAWEQARFGLHLPPRGAEEAARTALELHRRAWRSWSWWRQGRALWRSLTLI